MPRGRTRQLLELAQDQGGFITAEDARKLGIPAMNLVMMERRESLKRVSHGVYRVPSIPTTELDIYYQAALWPQYKGIISHQSALDLYQLSDVNPTKVHITVPGHYRTHREIPAWLEIHKRDLDVGQKTYREALPVTTVYQTFLDLIEDGFRSDLLFQAIENAQAEGKLLKDEADDLLLLSETKRSSEAYGQRKEHGFSQE